MTAQGLYISEHPRLQVAMSVFEFGEATPRVHGDHADVLLWISEQLKLFPGLVLRVEGHGQPGAPEPVASELAWARAVNLGLLMDYRYKVPCDRVHLTHRSNVHPRYEDEDQCRRVELLMIYSTLLESPDPEWPTKTLAELQAEFSSELADKDVVAEIASELADTSSASSSSTSSSSSSSSHD